MELNKIYNGNSLHVLKELPDNSIDCCVTSPPYWGLRNYNHDEQIGMEQTPDKFIQSLVDVFNEVKRVLKPQGTLWLNLGDTYSAHKDCKSVADTLRVGGKSEEANVIEKGKSNSRNSKLLKSVGLKNKDLIGVPWMAAFALRSSGWYLRQDIIWHKPNPMPESVTDRCTKSHEYIFLMSKSEKYYFDNDSIKTDATTKDLRPNGVERNRIYNYNSKENKNPEAYLKPYKNLKEKGQPNHTMHENRLKGEEYHSDKANKRSVWTVTTKPYSDAHFATFPQDLIVDCIKAGCPENGIVLDPFMGAGTTALVARKLNRNFIGIELNPDYVKIAENRLIKELGMFK
jgi:DNA modification methylase